uniref:U4/U6.U5 small nuclear ribonucleoprotein 27 kDa protein n=62 Tax=Aves TaxID=8782 RepID=A0A8C3NEA5_GEOPR
MGLGEIGVEGPGVGGTETLRAGRPRFLALGESRDCLPHSPLLHPHPSPFLLFFFSTSSSSPFPPSPPPHPYLLLLSFSFFPPTPLHLAPVFGTITPSHPSPPCSVFGTISPSWLIPAGDSPGSFPPLQLGIFPAAPCLLRVPRGVPERGGKGSPGSVLGFPWDSLWEAGREQQLSLPRAERRRSRSTSRDRDRRRRERSRSRDRDRRRSRSRSPHRRRSRSPRRHRSSSSSPARPKERRDEEKKELKDSKKERQITEEDLQGKTEEEIEMMKMMGFASFDTTKGKKVDGAANAYAINVSQKRKYRQYMNRKGGFNRPLDFIA